MVEEFFGAVGVGWGEDEAMLEGGCTWALENEAVTFGQRDRGATNDIAKFQDQVFPERTARRINNT